MARKSNRAIPWEDDAALKRDRAGAPISPQHNPETGKTQIAYHLLPRWSSLRRPSRRALLAHFKAVRP